MTDRLTLTVDDYAKAVQVTNRIETYEQWADRFITEQSDYIDELIGQRWELRRVVRTWEIAFLTLCAQFFVVCVAAVWGWAR